MKPYAQAFGKFATALALAAITAHSVAEQDKTIDVTLVQPFSALSGWVNEHPAPSRYSAPASIQTIALGSNTQPDTTPFEPAPVILGQPDVPLLGADAAQARSGWGEQLNYQGMQASLVVLDAHGQAQVRPLSDTLMPGERFKIRITPTFSALASIERVVGDPWYGRRAGQLYPGEGMSVQMHAGETVLIPLEPEQFFVFDQWRNERLLLQVRHARAQGEARSTQPTYRQDNPGGSSYLQLIPEGSFAAIEQLIAVSP